MRESTKLGAMLVVVTVLLCGALFYLITAAVDELKEEGLKAGLEEIWYGKEKTNEPIGTK